MLFFLKYLSPEDFTKPVLQTGSYEYLIQYARRMLDLYRGWCEIRNIHSTLVADLYAADDGSIVEWLNPDMFPKQVAS